MRCLREAAGRIDALRAQVAEEVERDAVDLALALAGKILAGNLQARPESMLDVVQGALRRVGDRRGLTVLINPADLATVMDALGEERASAKGIELQTCSPTSASLRAARSSTPSRARSTPGRDTAGAGPGGRRDRAERRRGRRVSDAAEPGALLARAAQAIHEADLARRHGFVSNLIGLIIEATGLQAEVGEVCLVGTDRNRAPVSAEVVGFRDGRTLLMPLGELHGIGPGTRVLATGAPFRVAVGDDLLGRIVSGLGTARRRRP